MRRLFPFFILFALAVFGCSQDKTDGENKKNITVVLEDNSTKRAVNIEVAPGTDQNTVLDPPEYVAKHEDELSLQDSVTAYDLCVRALTDYYNAVWNDSDIELDTFIANDNLQNYTQKKIESQSELYGNLSKVKTIEIDNWEVKYTDDAEGGFLYLEIPVHIHKFVGAYGEGTEFLVQNVDGKLVIVDWYTGAKDSYDFKVRGENLTINDPDIWDDSEWVEKLIARQFEL